LLLERIRGIVFEKEARRQNTKVLVCGLNPKFDENLRQDFDVYSQFYPGTKTAALLNVAGLSTAVRQGYDIVHIFADVSQDGFIGGADGSTLSGTSLIQNCCDSGVKLLWVASSNPPGAYVNGFKPGGNRINLVMTIDRRGSHFSDFLRGLLHRMSLGKPMPVAWSEVAPQSSGHPAHAGLPDTIFSAGHPAAKFSP